jgi:pimeloyl-ACP methyl ester carboxylesterase
MKVHFISGLGADDRVFKYLDLPAVEKVFVQWIKPLKQESITQYSTRLMLQIDTTQDVYLVGVSFGGMIAQEIAKQLVCKKVIIVSSIQTPQALSWQLKVVRLLQLHLLMPQFLLKWSNLLSANYYFSVKNRAEVLLLHQIIKDTDFDFAHWAIHQVINWKMPAHSITNIAYIHGTADRIFPINKHFGHFTPVEEGGHFMVVNKSAIISAFIIKHLHH